MVVLIVGTLSTALDRKAVALAVSAWVTSWAAVLSFTTIGARGGGPRAFLLLPGAVDTLVEVTMVLRDKGSFSLVSCGVWVGAVLFLVVVVVEDEVEVEDEVAVVVEEVEEVDPPPPTPPPLPSASEMGMAGKHSLSRSERDESASLRSLARLYECSTLTVGVSCCCAARMVLMEPRVLREPRELSCEITPSEASVMSRSLRTTPFAPPMPLLSSTPAQSVSLAARKASA